MFRDELAVDIREATLHWVRVGVGPKGRVVRDWGTRLRNPDLGERDAIREVLAVSGARRGTRVAVCLGDGHIAHRREELPRLPRSGLRNVVERRRRELAPDPGSCCFAWHRGSGPAAPIWYTTAPRATVEEILSLWAQAGARCNHLVSRHIALAQLARFASQAGDGDLVIFIDLEDETGACVVADRQGWVFSREVKLRTRLEGAADSEDQALALFGDENGLTNGKSDDVASLDPFEQASAVAERATTEIRRTIQFVTAELRLGRVSEVFVGGDGGEVAALTGPLASNLEVPVRPVSDLVGQVLDSQLGPTANGIGAALGLALASGRLDAAILPEPVKRAQRVRELRYCLTAGLVFAGLVVGGALAARQGHESTLEARLALLEEDWARDAPAREEIERAKAMRARALAIEGLTAEIHPPAPDWAALIANMGGTLPGYVWIDRLRAERRDGEWHLATSVEAQAPGMGEAATGISEFARALSGSPLVRVDRLVREPAARLDPERGEGAVRFLLEGRLSPVRRPVRLPASQGGAP